MFCERGWMFFGQELWAHRGAVRAGCIFGKHCSQFTYDSGLGTVTVTPAPSLHGMRI